jgi:outer membrane biosynthesis protein TonB
VKEAASFGGLLRAKGRRVAAAVRHPPARAGRECAALISIARLLLSGVLLLGFVALSAAQARAAQTPTPDPYPSRSAVPSVPAPDPYPSPATRTPAPAPAPAPRSSASEVADQRQTKTKTTPKPKKPSSSANQSGRNTTKRVAAPRTVREEKPKVAVVAAVAAVRDATGGRALLLGGLALLALVLASGSMLFLVTRSEGWEASR